ncbi:hypothetical protein WH47_01875, partial [Habropoda laboriosa]
RSLNFRELIAFPLLAKVAQILIIEDPIVPNNIKIACLKCLGNSCYNSYIHKNYASTNIEQATYHKLYSMLANNENLKEIQSSNSYPFDSHFPYEGVIEWASNFITSCKINSVLLDEKLEILRLYLLKSIQIIGKQSHNYFTPLQKLSDVALAMQEARNNEPETNSNSTKAKGNESETNSAESNLQSHPAFGFKAGLIRIIGNMSYRNKECQDLVSTFFFLYFFKYIRHQATIPSVPPVGKDSNSNRVQKLAPLKAQR